MQPNRASDDAAYRLAARRMDGRMVAGRLIVAGHERMLAQAGARLTRWLVGEGFARWGRPGLLFPHALGEDGVLLPVAAQGNMICAFALAGRLGWDGPWRTLVGDRLAVLLARARRGDGLFVHALGPDGAVVEAEPQAADQAAMARALALGGRALGRDDVAAMGADLRVRMSRAGMSRAGMSRAAMADGARDGVLGLYARDVLGAVARWQRLGQVEDARLALGAAAGLEAAITGTLPGLWRDGGDVWCFVQAAGALNGEDRIWFCP